jgi:predicted metal-dependent hydrolase
MYEKVCKDFEYKEYPKLKIKIMKTKWGSYSTKGKITLNPNLICFERKALEYVIYHELSHVKYTDHSKKYYKFLELKYPNWEKSKKLLENREVEIVFNL